LISGKGGDGIVHFRREKFVPYGGPDGGDGGRGGDVIFEVKSTLNTLAAFQHKHKFKAENGKNGGGNNKTGRSGEDLIIFVPPGTIIYDDTTGDVVGDLVAEGERLNVLQGGRAGRGNARFATSRNQAPRVAEKGEPARERQIRLELRLLADIGIVGVPNAGKSTLLAAVTNAKPKIAPYPFTTLEPNLGVAILDFEHSLVLADQRTRVLIHLLDGQAEDPLLDFAQINSELALFDPLLGSKPQIVVFNKIDLPEVLDRWPEVEAQLNKKGAGKTVKPMAISALARMNVKELLFMAARILAESEPPPELEQLPVYRMESDPKSFVVKREEQGWRVQGEAIERAAAMTYWELDQSVRRFQKILRTLGVEDELRSLGAKEGDTVYIGDNALEWLD
jgi:GTP-binding protein